MVTTNSLRSTAALALVLALLGAHGAHAQAPENSTDCSAYIRDIVAGIYDGDADNFDAVVRLGNLSANPNFKAEVLVALYATMASERHLEDPERALRLHNEMNALLEVHRGQLDADAARLLVDHVRELSQAVETKGSEVLQAAVYLHDCDRANSTVQRLLDQLQATNQSLSEATVNSTVERVRWALPLEDLVPALGNLSRHVAQNVDALLALYDPERVVGEVRVQFVIRLNQLREEPEYAATVSQAKQELVAELLTGPQEQLLAGLVCLYVQQPNGTRLYVHECIPSYSACVYAYEQPLPHAVLNVTRVAAADYNFKSKFYSYRPLRLVAGYPEQPGGIRLDVFSSSSYAGSIDWRVLELDDRVLLQNLNGTETLCGGSELARTNNQWLAYTRANGSLAAYADECRWRVQDCRLV